MFNREIKDNSSMVCSFAVIFDLVGLFLLVDFSIQLAGSLF